MTLPDLLSPDDFKILQLANELVGGERVRQVLNNNGACRFTVCPSCRVDDFVHVDDCPLSIQPGELNRKISMQKRLVVLNLNASVPENLSDEEALRLAQKAFDVGLADANNTLHDGDADQSDAQAVTSIEFCPLQLRPF